jgi:hypothetical protein
MQAGVLGAERLREMGIAGNEFMRKARSWDSVADQTAEVYLQAEAVRFPRHSHLPKSADWQDKSLRS